MSHSLVYCKQILQVAELKKELADRGLSTKGVKSELVSRLEIYLEQGRNYFKTIARDTLILRNSCKINLVYKT